MPGANEAEVYVRASTLCRLYNAVLVQKRFTKFTDGADSVRPTAALKKGRHAGK